MGKKREGINPDFFFHLFDSDAVHAEFAQLAAGVTVKNLNIEWVKGVKVPVPPLREQRRIAQVMDQRLALESVRSIDASDAETDRFDTNILVAALLRGGGSARATLRACLRGTCQPVLGPALLAEYEDVLGRDELFATSALSARERQALFDGYLSVCRWVEVFHAWRPNLPDESDNHLIELAVAAQANAIVTRNLRDVSRGEL